jgi:hypothetical protein
MLQQRQRGQMTDVPAPNEPVRQMAFTAALLHYFGKQPNQDNAKFLLEMKALSPEDKAWLKEHLKSVGYEIT